MAIVVTVLAVVTVVMVVVRVMADLLLMVYGGDGVCDSGAGHNGGNLWWG